VTELLDLCQIDLKGQLRLTRRRTELSPEPKDPDFRLHLISEILAIWNHQSGEVQRLPADLTPGELLDTFVAGHFEGEREFGVTQGQTPILALAAEACRDGPYTGATFVVRRRWIADPLIRCCEVAPVAICRGRVWRDFRGRRLTKEGLGEATLLAYDTVDVRLFHRMIELGWPDKTLFGWHSANTPD
jgi:hypothetical protein